MTRREMLRQSALATGCLCTCGAFRSFAQASDCCNTPDLEPESYTIQEERILVDISKAPCLAEPGHAAFISVPDKNIEIILIRSEKETFAALSRFCTHAMQVLSYNPERGLLQCNGYNHSLFELNGQVFKGPAEKPLFSYPVSKNEHQLCIMRKET